MSNKLLIVALTALVALPGAAQGPQPAAHDTPQAAAHYTPQAAAPDSPRGGAGPARMLWTAADQKAALEAARATVNYDEAAVGPYSLEDPLTFEDGRKLRRRRQWPQRRAEILETFQREMFGRIPESCDIFVDTLEAGPSLAGLGRREQLRMWFRPDRTGPHVDWLIVRPAFAKAPVPAVMLLNYGGNHEVLFDEEILVPESWMRNKQGRQDNRASALTRGKYNRDGERYIYPAGMFIARGYALVTACYCDVSPDPDPGETDGDGIILQDSFAYSGVFDLWGRRDPSRTDNTTALGAWAWALMRGMDMIEAHPGLDASRVVLTGCSRLGKAALIAAAFDERFPMVAPVQTGGGGVPLAKRNFGETVGTETAAFRHWYCAAYDKYATDPAALLHFDQHLLLSCVAPRALLVEGFDGRWFDTKGEFLALQAASPVWKFLGVKGLPDVAWPEPYDTSAIGPLVGYVYRDQKHGISPIDWEWMLDFADTLFK